MKRLLSLFVSGLLLLNFASTGFAQTDKALLRELAEENKKSVDALALYPLETRLAILEATKYPEVLIKMNSARQKTSAAFRTLIEDFPRPTQEVFYNLVRYPELITQIASHRDSPSAIREALQRLPENQRDDAFDVVQRHKQTVLSIDDLNRTALQTFQDLIAAYPATARDAFRQLLNLPEVLEILNEDLRFTILVGDVYREDPAWVIQKTDSLNLALARANAEELDEWKQAIENDPEAQKELESAAQEYARDNGYDTETYPYDDLYYDNRFEQQVTVVEYAYPWWYGYPWWYPQPCWRPYPWWYDWGYYHHHNTFVVIYMPSGYFMDWYFDHPYHHYHYNHLSAHFVNHYYGHRHSGTTISMGVGAWHDRNRDIISDDWMRDKKQLPDRLKEYGRFEEKRQEYNARNPRSKASPSDFLDKNAREYPALNQGRTQVKADDQRQEKEAQARPDAWAPRKEPVQPEPSPKTDKQPQQKPPANREPQQQPQQRPKEEPAPPVKKDRPLDKAEDYHRQKWDEKNRAEPARQPAPSRPQSQPQPTKPNDKQRKTDRKKD